VYKETKVKFLALKKERRKERKKESKKRKNEIINTIVIMKVNLFANKFKFPKVRT
jgi:ribosomal protein S25